MQFDVCLDCYTASKSSAEGSARAAKGAQRILDVERKAVHATVTCDGCGMQPLVGLRKSMNKHAYNTKFIYFHLRTRLLIPMNPSR